MKPFIIDQAKFHNYLSTVCLSFRRNLNSLCRDSYGNQRFDEVNDKHSC